VFPTFDGNRAPWTYLEHYGIPIQVDSGVSFGLTNPNVGDTDYFVLLFNEDRGVNFNVDNISSYGAVDIGTYELGMTIEGIHDGPGNPLDNIIVTGHGVVDVFILSESDPMGFPRGSFTVVPEPATLVLLSIGFMGMISCRKN